MKRIHVAYALIFLLATLLLHAHNGAAAGGTTYYVSNSLGNDNNNGLSEGAPFKSINKVNSLNLGAGDRVLFKCGDSWRAQSLVITDSIQPSEAVRSAPNIRIVPTAPLLAQATLNIWNGTSVSSLFDDTTLTPIYESMYSPG